MSAPRRPGLVLLSINLLITLNHARGQEVTSIQPEMSSNRDITVTSSIINSSLVDIGHMYSADNDTQPEVTQSVVTVSGFVVGIEETNANHHDVTGLHEIRNVTGSTEWKSYQTLEPDVGNYTRPQLEVEHTSTTDSDQEVPGVIIDYNALKNLFKDYKYMLAVLIPVAVGVAMTLPLCLLCCILAWIPRRRHRKTVAKKKYIGPRNDKWTLLASSSDEEA